MTALGETGREELNAIVEALDVIEAAALPPAHPVAASLFALLVLREIGGRRREPGLDGLEPDADEMELRLAIGELMEDLSESHQVVVVLYCYMQWPAADAAKETNQRIPDADMTENNVQQIGSRFRKALRKLLGGGDTPDGS